MPSYKFTDVLGAASRKKNVMQNAGSFSLNWFWNKVQELEQTVGFADVARRFPKAVYSNLLLGRMYLFTYDPKLKDSLPYYDMLPLVFPIKFRPAGFLGLNLHYLPPDFRAMFMDGLFTLKSNNRFDETTFINVNYNVLKASRALSLYRPCIKMYLHNHVRTQFLRIHPLEWHRVLFLPFERFAKEKKETVWSESLARSA